jgi:hypothetical protein
LRTSLPRISMRSRCSRKYCRADVLPSTPGPLPP